MKIVHVIIACFYKEGYGYQENILPAKHKKLGFNTYIVTKNEEYPLGHEYINSDGINITLLPINEYSSKRYLSLVTSNTRGLYTYLDRITPDIIFVHGLQSIDSLIVCKWCSKHPEVKLFVDQHADYYNTPLTNFKSRIYTKLVYGYIAKKMSKYAEKFWGVTPWRMHYLQYVYGIKPELIDLLVMGGDEEQIDWDGRTNVRQRIRAQYDIPQDAFLIVSGGKIDRAKNIHLLLDAVEGLRDRNVWLLLFGDFDKEMRLLCQHKFVNNIKYIGWIDSRDVYQYFLSSDLVVFPGTHSVLWEQAVACGCPGLFRDWDGGFSHIDCGGNAKLIKKVSSKILIEEINSLLQDRCMYENMRSIAETKARKVFSYIEIAKKSINLTE